MTAPNFSRRSAQPELMDSKDISFNEFHDCLRELEQINTFTLAYRPTLHWLRRIKGNQPLTVIDAGSGGGDMLRRVAKCHPSFTLTGADINPWAKQSAALMTPEETAIRFETTDIFNSNGKDVDLIISSLFTHHLSDGQIINFLQWMDATARRGWFINDLHRHPLPYYFIKYAVKFFCRNRLVQHDAPVSVARAFTRTDWQGLLARAGIAPNRVQVQWFFPFRYCIACEKT